MGKWIIINRRCETFDVMKIVNARTGGGIGIAKFRLTQRNQSWSLDHFKKGEGDKGLSSSDLLLPPGELSDLDDPSASDCRSVLYLGLPSAAAHHNKPRHCGR